MNLRRCVRSIMRKTLRFTNLNLNVTDLLTRWMLLNFRLRRCKRQNPHMNLSSRTLIGRSMNSRKIIGRNIKKQRMLKKIFLRSGNMRQNLLSSYLIWRMLSVDFNVISLNCRPSMMPCNLFIVDIIGR